MYTSHGNAYWRPYEKESLEKYFGKPEAIEHADYLFTRLNTESISRNYYKHALEIEDKFKGHVINPTKHFKYTNNKEECFAAWRKAGIPIPNYFEYIDRDDFENKKIDFPFLIRLNDCATGEHTYLVTNKKELDQHFNELELSFKAKQRINTKKICVQFIDTKVQGFHTSFRIHVAGNSVISGYGRLSESWLAITGKFEEAMREEWVNQNAKAQEIIEQNYDLIVKSVSCLGLHHQGVDVITNKDNDIYFLEVQPFYFSGRNHGQNDTLPPFWNPYKPKHLVDWLINEKSNLYKKIPQYYDLWLNKEQHFDTAYKELKRCLDPTQKRK